MQKAIAIGMLVVASMLFVGCQQKPADQTQPQQQSSKATITIEQPETSTSKATLEILPSTTEEALPTEQPTVPGRVPVPEVTAPEVEPTPVTAITMELP